MAKNLSSPLTAASVAVIVSSVVMAAGLTFADHDAACGGPGSMPSSPPSGQWYECNTATAQWELKGTPGESFGCSNTMPPIPQQNLPAGQWYECINNVWELRGTSTPSGICSSEPNWPDCKTKQCTNGNWTCTEMYNTTSGGVCPEFTMYRGCIESCMSRGGAMSCPMCGAECSNSGGGTGDPATCTACITAGGTRLTCPTCPGYTGGSTTSGGGGTTSYADCMARECSMMVTEATQTTCRASCEARFGGGSYGGVYGGAGGIWGSSGGGGTMGGGNATCVAECVATTPGMCTEPIAPGKRSVCDFKRSRNWSGTACEEFCNGTTSSRSSSSTSSSTKSSGPTIKECGSPPVFGKAVLNLRCVNGEWAWDQDDRQKPPEDLCKIYPEKCKKTEPKPGDNTLLQQLESLEREIALTEDKLDALDDQIDTLQEKLQTLKEQKAKKTEITKVKKEGKKLMKQQQKLQQKLDRLNRKYDVLSRQASPPPRPITF